MAVSVCSQAARGMADTDSILAFPTHRSVRINLLRVQHPRMGRRIDVALVAGRVVFAIELKVGERRSTVRAIDQVWDYALDLKNFHEASHHAAIVPILVFATEATDCPPLALHADADQVYRPLLVTPATFRDAIDSVVADVRGASVNANRWSRAPYHPTPTIVEAARAQPRLDS